MTTAVRGSGVPGASWRSHQVKTTTAGGTVEFTVDSFHNIYQIGFFEAAGDGSLLTATATIFAENQIIFNGIPIPMLASVGAVNLTPATTGSLILWVPVQVIAFSPSWPIQITCSVTTVVAIFGREVGPG